MSNIWHDINPRRISPEKFMAVIEIPKGVKNKYEMDKETGLLKPEARLVNVKDLISEENRMIDFCALTAYFTHQLTILQTTDLFRERMRRIMTRLTFLYFVRNQ